MTTPAYRSKASLLTGTAGEATFTEPTGAAENDILLVSLLIEDGATIGADMESTHGWTLAKNVAGAADSRHLYYWRRRGADALTSAQRNFWWSPTSYYELSCTAYSGAKTSGSPWGATDYPASVSTATTINPGAITTTANDSLIITGGAHWTGAPSGGWTAPSGYTGIELGSEFQGIALAYKALTGNSGTSQDPGAFDTVTSGEVYAVTLELLSADPSGGGTTTRNFTMMGLGS